MQDAMEHTHHDGTDIGSNGHIFLVITFFANIMTWITWAGILKAIPTIAQAVSVGAGSMAMLYYAVSIYDKLKKKKNNENK